MSTLRFNVRSNLGSNICSALCSKDRTNIFYPGTHSNAGSGRIAKDSAHCNGPSAIKYEGLRINCGVLLANSANLSSQRA